MLSLPIIHYENYSFEACLAEEPEEKTESDEERETKTKSKKKKKKSNDQYK